MLILDLGAFRLLLVFRRDGPLTLAWVLPAAGKAVPCPVAVRGGPLRRV